MFFYASVFQILVLAVLVSIVGQALARFFPDRIEKHCQYFAPVLGLCLFIFFAVAYGWMHAFNFKISLLIVLASVGIALFAVKEKSILFVDTLWFAGFSLLASLPILAPLILFDSFNPFNDTFTYLVHGQWLQSNAFSTPVVASGHFPAETQVVLYQKAGHRMGASFFLAFAQSLFRVEWSYYMYIPVVSVIFSVGCYSVAGVIARQFHFEKYKALLIALTPAVSMNGYVFGAQYGFLPQTTGLSIFIALVGLVYFYMDWMSQENIKPKQLFMSFVPLSLLVGAILFCYNDMFAFVGGGLFFFLVIGAFRYRDKIKLISTAVLIIFIQTAILVNVEGLRIVKNFINTVLNAASGTVVFGWPVKWEVIQFYAHSFGFKSPHDASVFNMDYLVSVWLMPLMLLFLVFILLQLLKKKDGRILVDLFIAFNTLFLIVFVKFRYFTIDIAGQQGHTFLQFKIATWLCAVNLIITGIAIAWIYQTLKISTKLKNATLAACIIFGASVQMFIAAPNFTNHFMMETSRDRSAFNFFIELRQKLENIPKDETIYLGIPHEHHKLTQMVAYILHDRKLAGEYKDGYLRGSLPPKDRDMSLDSANWLVEYKTTRTSDELLMNRHGSLYISKTPFNVASLVDHEGGYNTEMGDGNLWNWVENQITYSFNIISERKEVVIAFDYLLAGDEREMEISIQSPEGNILFEDKLQLQQGWSYYESDAIPLTDTDVELRITADGEPVRLSERDARMAKFLIQNVGLIFP